MARRRTSDLSVGALFALALIVLAVTIMAVGGESRLFAQKADYRVIFPNATGLSGGSPVKMAGVQIGSVTDIRLSTDPRHGGIEVLLGIDRSYTERVREDSRAALRILQLLSGEKFVEILPGSAEVPVLAQGSVIEPKQDPELLQQAAMATENINDITVSLKNILGMFERGEGLIGAAIADPEFGKEGLDALRATLENLQLLTADLLQGRTPRAGFLSRMLYDPDFADKIDDLGRAFERIAIIVDGIDPEQGALGELLREDGAGKALVTDLRDAAGSLKRVTAGLESKEGLVGRLLNDKEYSEGLADDLRTTLGNLAQISDKLNRGEGTLGALINERVLHDSLEDVVAGLNDSKFARWLIRHYQKKGIKMETADATE